MHEPPVRLEALVARLSLEEKVALLTGQDTWSLRPVPSIGLRSIVMSDGPAGVRGTTWDERHPSVNFPSPTAVAASWDRVLVHAIGSGLGSEARRKGVDVLLAPTVNLHRTPYGGRHFEAFSEDPELTSELATHLVRGVQDHGVAATVKHYVANDSETDRFTVDVEVSDRVLRELYLRAFEGPVVDGPAWAVMSAYNSINGATATENTLLTSPLQDEWGFDGVVVSDWTAVRSTRSARHPQDLAMPGPHGAWGGQLVAAVRKHEVEEAAIDRKVHRVLRLAARVGALDGIAAERHAEPLTPDQLAALARAAARDGMVLLRTDGSLPLEDPSSIAVIGEAARIARTQGGGSATVMPASVSTPLDAITRRWPDADVSWSHGAVVQRGLVPLEKGTFRTPDGGPGLLVRYLDAAGDELGRESREASWLVWFNGSTMGTRATQIELSFRYRPEVPPDGGVELGVGGLADVEVEADGRLVSSEQIRLAPGDDPATVVLNPPFTSVHVPSSGPTVDVVVRFRPMAGDMPDARALRVGTPPPRHDAESLIDEAVRAASSAEVAVVVVGTSNEVESEGFDRSSLGLPGRQDDLVRAVAAVNPRTIVVVNAGAPVILPWRDEVAAVVAAWFPGQEFGDALADVLSGDHEPGGRLPVTWPADEADVPVRDVVPTDGRLAYREGLHIGYKAWLRTGSSPAYAFGHGLGYTDWSLSELRATEVPLAGSRTVSLTVTNTGQRAGKCVVQLYLERLSPSTVERPRRWLAGFETVHVDAGASRRIELDVPWRRLAHWTDGAWIVEAGTYGLVAGLSSTDDRAQVSIAVGPGQDVSADAIPADRVEAGR